MTQLRAIEADGFVVNAEMDDVLETIYAALTDS
jgi:hypothetical protein